MTFNKYCVSLSFVSFNTKIRHNNTSLIEFYIQWQVPSVLSTNGINFANVAFSSTYLPSWNYRNTCLAETGKGMELGCVYHSLMPSLLPILIAICQSAQNPCDFNAYKPLWAQTRHTQKYLMESRPRNKLKTLR